MPREAKGGSGMPKAAQGSLGRPWEAQGSPASPSRTRDQEPWASRSPWWWASEGDQQGGPAGTTIMSNEENHRRGGGQPTKGHWDCPKDNSRDPGWHTNTHQGGRDSHRGQHHTFIIKNEITPRGGGTTQQEPLGLLQRQPQEPTSHLYN